jgi:hypothetical protein
MAEAAGSDSWNGVDAGPAALWDWAAGLMEAAAATIAALAASL